MLFNSVPFIFAFLPLTVIGFFVLARFSQFVALAFLVAASLTFYVQMRLSFILILAPSIIFNYSIGLLLFHFEQRKRPIVKRFILIVALCTNLAVLFYFKYLDFLITSINWIGIGPLPQQGIALPLGISFFTFTQIAFLVDAYQRKVQEAKFINYALFVSYFPHLIAGPVLHHKEMMPQFSQPPTFKLSAENFAVGLTIFTIGLFKKVVLADSIAPHVHTVFNAASSGTQLTALEAWSGALFYSFQIYYDFSGYSDMAIGLSRLFGVLLPLNFNSPYKATNIIEFWRRWHMTLSRFLRDYLYFPLGGNRNGRVRRMLNLMIVMVLGGAWHGAGWTYFIWGGLHGLYLVVNHMWRTLFGHKPRSALTQYASWLFTFIVVTFAWVFFRAPDVSTAWLLVKGMLGCHGIIVNNSTNALPSIELSLLATILLGIAWFAPNTQEIMRDYRPALSFQVTQVPWLLRWSPNFATATFVGLLAVASLMVTVYTKRVSDFIYFQF